MVLAIVAVLWISTLPGKTDSEPATPTAQAGNFERQNQITFALIVIDNRPVVECLIAFRLLPPFDHVLDSLRSLGKGLAELLEELAITSETTPLLPIRGALKSFLTTGFFYAMLSCASDEPPFLGEGLVGSTGTQSIDKIFSRTALIQHGRKELIC